MGESRDRKKTREDWRSKLTHIGFAEEKESLTTWIFIENWGEG